MKWRWCINTYNWETSQDSVPTKMNIPELEHEIQKGKYKQASELGVFESEQAKLFWAVGQPNFKFSWESITSTREYILYY